SGEGPGTCLFGYLSHGGRIGRHADLLPGDDRDTVGRPERDGVDLDPCRRGRAGRIRHGLLAVVGRPGRTSVSHKADGVRCRVGAVRAGWAKATTSRTRPRNTPAAGTWRCHPGRRGATDANMSTLVKRTTTFCRARCKMR